MPTPILTGNNAAQDDLSTRYNALRDQGLSKAEAHKAAFNEVRNRIEQPRAPTYPATDPMGLDQETDWS